MYFGAENDRDVLIYEIYSNAVKYADIFFVPIECSLTGRQKAMKKRTDRVGFSILERSEMKCDPNG